MILETSLVGSGRNYLLIKTATDKFGHNLKSACPDLVLELNLDL